MPWARLDDDFHDNGKILSLSHQAFRLYVCAITYSRRHRTNGFLSRDQVGALCGQQRVNRKTVTELLEKRAWHAAGGQNHGPGGYEIHDFETYQPKGDETAAERMRRHRERNKTSHSHGPVAPNVTPGYADVTRNGDAPVPIPIPNTPGGKPPGGDVPSPDAPRAVPKPAQSPAALSAHQALFEAVVARFGTPANDAERGKYARAVKLLTQAGVAPAEVAVLADAIEERWPNAECTPLSIASNVTTLRGPPKPASVPATNGHRETTRSKLDRVFGSMG